MLHDGHRERLRQKAESDVTELHEKLELFLFGVLPRVNTNEIAHDLLNRFGGIDGVLCANIEQLKSVPGVGHTAAIYIKNLAGILREYQLSLCHTSELLTSDWELNKYLSALFIGTSYETMIMLMFSAKGKFLGSKTVGAGTYSQNLVAVRQAQLYALSANAASLIFAHNHPNKLALPSDTDIESAAQLNIRFKNIGIDILEHYIIANGRCVPYSDKIDEYFEESDD